VDVNHSKSRDVIDRRKVAIGGGILVAIGVLLGWRAIHVPTDPDRDLVEVVSTALDRGQLFWAARVHGYRRAAVVLFEERTPTACGAGETAFGPFYCDADERIYLDLSFLRAIDGELARAYVVAHELGHHVQKLRGTAKQGVDLELEADCLAGWWMADERARGHLAGGDIDAALSEASAVGDDRLCPACTRDQWTHGSSDQRMRAVRAGLETSNCGAFQ
jgi:predicted metalloprotease